jgi:two-component system cell cycle sensor histidine kinase PleC
MDIRDSGRQLPGLISAVLEMSCLDAGRVRLEKRDIKIDTVVSAAIQAIKPAAAEKSITITSQIAADASLHGDRTALERVVTALLHNAVKFTPRHGSINVRTRRVHDALNIYVEDNGAGIAPEALSRLGRPFEQWNPPLANGMKGSGLGLAIAHSLVALHDGTLRIRSTPGTGTVVLVHLPVEPAARARNPSLAAPHQLPRGADYAHLAARDITRAAHWISQRSV